MKLTLLAIIITCCQISSAKTFKVAIPNFSHSIKPESYRYHPMVYILRQLHETLFIKNKNGVSSNILEKWSSNKDYTEYNLCLKKGNHFSNGKPLGIEDLKENFISFKKKNFFPKELSLIKTSDSCLDLRFNQSYYGFVSDMQSLKMAIIDSSTENSEVPIGISPYRISSFLDGVHLILTTADHVKEKPYFNRIEMIVFDQRKVSIKELSSYHEINLLSELQLPDEKDLLKYFDRYEIFEPKNLYMLNNNPNASLRRIFRNCIDQEKIVNSLGLHVKRKLTNYMPKISGIKSNFQQKCSTQKKLPENTNIDVLYYLNGQSQTELQKEMDRSLAPFNIQTKVKKMDKRNVISILESSDRKYDVIILTVNGLNFDVIGRDFGLSDPEHTFISVTVPNRMNLLNLVQNGTPSEKIGALERFYQSIDSQDKIIPLAELNSFAYYPSTLNIYNENSNFSFFEYQIKDLRSK